MGKHKNRTPKMDWTWVFDGQSPPQNGVSALIAVYYHGRIWEVQQSDHDYQWRIVSARYGTVGGPFPTWPIAMEMLRMGVPLFLHSVA